MHWGLIPWWWKKPLKELPASFNARAESVADRPMFRGEESILGYLVQAKGIRSTSKVGTGEYLPLLRKKWCKASAGHMSLSRR
jgi:SOS response associated peptidase (SRAP)